jgi:hypothetical protein
VPTTEVEVVQVAADVAGEVALADTVRVDLQVVLDGLWPRERGH